MAPKSRAPAAKSEPKAATTAAKGRKRSVAKPASKPATSTQTAPSRRKRESTTATASMSGPAAEKGRRSIKPEPAATKEALPSKRAKLEAVPEEEESMQPVEHPSRLKMAGDMYVFGTGDCGQFGNGDGEKQTTAGRPFPSAIPDKQVIQLAAGGMHSVALTDDGEVWTTGVNDEGALGRETAGELWENAVHAQGAPTDSYRWGRVNVPTSHGKVIQVSAGDSHTVALTELGAIYAWGTFRNASGVFGFSPTESIAVLPTLVHEPFQAAHQAIKIASGADHAMALTRGGALLSWGTGQQGQLGRVGTRLPKRTLKETLLRPHSVPFTRRIRGVPVPHIIDFDCGTYGAFALSEGGHVYAWGLNNYGQLGLPGQEPVYSPALVRELEGEKVVQVKAGQHHSLFLTEDGRVLSCGRPTYGRLGRPDLDINSDAAMPVPGQVHVGSGTTVVFIAAGPEVSGAITNDGRAWLWGMNTNGQLGKGTNDDADEAEPKLLAETKRFSGRTVVQLEFGGQHTLLLAEPLPDAAPKGEAAAAPAAAPAEEGADAEEEAVATDREVDAGMVEATAAPQAQPVAVDDEAAAVPAETAGAAMDEDAPAAEEAAPAAEEAAPAVIAPAAAAAKVKQPSRKRRAAAAVAEEGADGSEAAGPATKPKRARKTKAAVAEAMAGNAADAGNGAAANVAEEKAELKSNAPKEAAAQDAVMEEPDADGTASKAAAADEEDTAETDKAAPAEEAEPMVEEAAPVKAAAPSRKRKVAAANGKSQRVTGVESVSKAEPVPQTEAAPPALSEDTLAAEPAAGQDAAAEPPAGSQAEAVVVPPEEATLPQDQHEPAEAVAAPAKEPGGNVEGAASVLDEAGAAAQPARDAADMQPPPLNGDAAMIPSVILGRAAPLVPDSSVAPEAGGLQQPESGVPGVGVGGEPVSSEGAAVAAASAPAPVWDASILAEAIMEGPASKEPGSDAAGGGPAGNSAGLHEGRSRASELLNKDAPSDVPSVLDAD